MHIYNLTNYQSVVTNWYRTGEIEVIYTFSDMPPLKLLLDKKAAKDLKSGLKNALTGNDHDEWNEEEDDFYQWDEDQDYLDHI